MTTRKTPMSEAERKAFIETMAVELVNALGVAVKGDSKSYQRTSLSLARMSIGHAFSTGVIDGLNRSAVMFDKSIAKSGVK